MNNRGSKDSVAQTVIFRDTEITIRFNQRKSQRSLIAKETLINCQYSTTDILRNLTFWLHVKCHV